MQNPCPAALAVLDALGSRQCEPGHVVFCAVLEPRSWSLCCRATSAAAPVAPPVHESPYDLAARPVTGTAHKPRLSTTLPTPYHLGSAPTQQHAQLQRRSVSGDKQPPINKPRSGAESTSDRQQTLMASPRRSAQLRAEQRIPGVALGPGVLHRNESRGGLLLAVGQRRDHDGISGARRWYLDD